MPDLRPKQEYWLRELINDYFPLIFPGYPVGIFKKYLRFRGEKDPDGKEIPLVLPKHLQFFDDLKPGFPFVELDLPEMLGSEPFLSLIGKKHLVETRKKVIDGRYNILEDIINKEDEPYHNAMRLKFPGSTIAKDVPRLFFDILERKNIKTEYVYKCKKHCFIWDFKNMLAHKPRNRDDICEAYSFFVRKVNNLKAFGIKEKIETADYNKLMSCFFDFLKKSGLVFENDKFNIKASAFNFMVNDVLERKPKENYYFPVDLKFLLKKIKKESPVNLLLRKYNDNLAWENLRIYFSPEEESNIREISTKVYKYISTEFMEKNFCEELKKVLEGSSISEKVTALFKLASKFLDYLRAQNILTKLDIKRIIFFYRKLKTLSIDFTYNDSDGKESKLDDKELISIFDTFIKDSIEDKNYLLLLEGIKSHDIKVSISNFIIYLEYHFKVYSIIPDISSEYYYDMLFNKHYLKLRGPIDIDKKQLGQIKKLFKKKVCNYLLSIKKKDKSQEADK